MDFVIEMKGYNNFVITTLEDKPDIPVKIIDDRSQLEELILGQSPPIESSSGLNAIYMADRRKRQKEERHRQDLEIFSRLSDDDIAKILKEHGIE